jgi:hypothetical protein
VVFWLVFWTCIFVNLCVLFGFVSPDLCYYSYCGLLFLYCREASVRRFEMSGQQEDGTSECGQESIEDEVYDACRTRCPCF